MTTKTMPTPDDIQVFIDLSGGAPLLADLANISRVSVYRWKYRKRVPAEHVALVSRLSGRPLSEIRPDVFPK